MSLTQFVERPAIRDAFQRLAVRPALPFDPKVLAPLAPSCGQHHSAVGTAFDYMARWRLVRDVLAEGGNVTMFEAGWAAEDAVNMMCDHPYYGRDWDRWRFLLDKARELFDGYIHGRMNDPERVAKCVQFLGAADLLVRTGRFNPRFAPRPEVTAELLALDAAYNPVKLFHPERVALLNPVFIKQDRTDGGDADLLIDGTIIDIKTVIDARLAAAHLRQLSGYAVLQGMGGADIGHGEIWHEPVEQVGIYFSRFGAFARWRLDDLFPNGGFNDFRAACEAEMDIYAAEKVPSTPGPGPR